jgi:hypothetical protein
VQRRGGGTQGAANNNEAPKEPSGSGPYERFE